MMKMLLVTGVHSWENEQLFKVAGELGHDIKWIEPKNLTFNTGKELPIFYKGEPLEGIDVAIYRTCRPWTSRACLLADYLRDAGALVTDGIFKHNLGKMSQLIKLQRAGLPVPHTVLSSKALLEIPPPLLTKPIGGRKGKGIQLFLDEEIPSYTKKKIGKTRMVQEYILGSYELRILVVLGEVVGAMKKIPQKGEFRANVALGAKVQKHDPDPVQTYVARMAALTLSTDIAGVDLIVTEADKHYILEVNRIPQFKGLEQAMGISIAEKIINRINDYVNGGGVN